MTDYTGRRYVNADLQFADTHCHKVREGDETPCTARPDEPHVDAGGREYVTVPLDDYADEPTEEYA